MTSSTFQLHVDFIVSNMCFIYVTLRPITCRGDMSYLNFDRVVLMLYIALFAKLTVLLLEQTIINDIFHLPSIDQN